MRLNRYQILKHSVLATCHVWGNSTKLGKQIGSEQKRNRNGRSVERVIYVIFLQRTVPASLQSFPLSPGVSCLCRPPPPPAPPVVQPGLPAAVHLPWLGTLPPLPGQMPAPEREERRSRQLHVPVPRLTVHTLPAWLPDDHRLILSVASGCTEARTAVSACQVGSSRRCKLRDDNRRRTAQLMTRGLQVSARARGLEEVRQHHVRPL